MLASAMPTGGKVAKAYTRGTYSYANDYTLGYEGGVVAYKDGKKVKIDPNYLHLRIPKREYAGMGYRKSCSYTAC